MAKSYPKVLLGPVPIDTQKQVPPRLSTIDSHHKNAIPGRFIMRVSVRPGDEGRVLDCDGVQLAGPHADEGVPGRLWQLLGNLEPSPVFLPRHKTS